VKFPKLSLASLLVVVVAGCTGSPEPVAAYRDKRMGDREQETVDHEKKTAEERPREPYVVRVNRTYLYPVQWTRAEDLAATLRPLLVNQYGPNATVIVHKATNHLLISIPPASERRRPNRRYRSD